MRMVVKTLSHLVVCTKCIHLDTMEVEDFSFRFPLHGKKIPDEAKIARMINSNLAKDGVYKLIKIVSINVEVTKFGMEEEKFIANATVID